MVGENDTGYISFGRMLGRIKVVVVVDNKTKVVSHKTYGLRIIDHFTCNPYHCMGNLPEPPLMHRFV